MNETIIKTDEKKNLDANNKIHANDDDLYAANLIEQIKVGKSNKYWKIATIFTVAYVFIFFAFLYLNHKSEIISLNSIISIFQIQKIQFYSLIGIIPIPLIWIYFITNRKLHELTVISDGLLKTALRLTHPAKSSEKAILSLSGAIKNEINQITSSVNEAIRKSSDIEKTLSAEIEQIESSMMNNENKMFNIIDALLKIIFIL